LKLQVDLKVSPEGEGFNPSIQTIKSKLFLLEMPGSIGFLHKSLDFILVWISPEIKTFGFQVDTKTRLGSKFLPWIWALFL